MTPTGRATCMRAVEALGQRDRSPGTSKLEHPQTGNPQSLGEAQGAPAGPAQPSVSSQPLRPDMLVTKLQKIPVPSA